MLDPQTNTRLAFLGGGASECLHNTCPGVQLWLVDWCASCDSVYEHLRLSPLVSSTLGRAQSRHALLVAEETGINDSRPRQTRETPSNLIPGGRGTRGRDAAACASGKISLAREGATKTSREGTVSV